MGKEEAEDDFFNALIDFDANLRFDAFDDDALTDAPRFGVIGVASLGAGVEYAWSLEAAAASEVLSTASEGMVGAAETILAWNKEIKTHKGTHSIV